MPILQTSDWSTVAGVTTPDENQLTPAEELEQAGIDYATWRQLDGEVKAAEGHLAVLLAQAILKLGGKIVQLREERRVVALRLADRYDRLAPHRVKKNTRTIELPGKGQIRKQAAGGLPEIKVVDQKLAILKIQSKRWARDFLVWKVSINKRRLQEDTDRAEKIPGIEVITPPEGFVIDGKKIDLTPETAE